MSDNVALVSGVQQSDSVIHVHISIFFKLFSNLGYCQILNIFVQLHNKFLLVIYFKYSSMYMHMIFLIPSQYLVDSRHLIEKRSPKDVHV